MSLYHQPKAKTPSHPNNVAYTKHTTTIHPRRTQKPHHARNRSQAISQYSTIISRHGFSEGITLHRHLSADAFGRSRAAKDGRADGWSYGCAIAGRNFREGNAEILDGGGGDCVGAFDECGGAGGGGVEKEEEREY